MRWLGALSCGPLTGVIRALQARNCQKVEIEKGAQASLPWAELGSQMTHP